MYLKIMSLENLPDQDSRKTFDVYSGITRVTFFRRNGAAFAEIYCFGDLETAELAVPGNAYVMNDAGKTIASFGAGSTAEDVVG